MHKSNELWEVVAVVFEKLQELKFSIDGAAFIITLIEGSRDSNIWLADDHGQPYPSSLRLPYYDSPLIKDIWLAKESGLDFFSKTYSFEEKNHWLSYAFEHTDMKILTDDLKNWILEQPCLTQPFALGKHSLIGIHFHHQRTLTDAEVDILKRFSKVFDQAYIRFLDLQKAEAQARESQIQLALERVRARTMAMQRSDELIDAASLLFKQIAGLGTRQWSSGFDIWNANEVSAVAWMSNPDGSMGVPFIVPYTEDPFFKKIYEARQSGEDFFVMESSGKELEETYQYLFNLPEAKKHFDGIESLGFQMPKFQITHCAFFSQGYLMFITFEAAPEMWDIFKRFAKVFEQTYTRFLDLQKAEAQAREAQIEAALERVRAKTMSMQKSDELSETAVLLFHQLISLGLELRGCGFNIWEKHEKTCTSWMSGPGGKLSIPFNLPLTEDPFFIRYYESRQNGEDFWVYETRKEELVARYKYLRTLPVLGELLAKELKDGIEIEVPSLIVDHVVNFSNGNLIFITYEPCPDAWDIFKRFGKVFEQTYTRFLDLQKAEAQAREAQIEAALERVRSRSMGMQKSEELKEVIQVVYDQFIHLNIKVGHTGFVMDYKTRDDYNIWIADPLGVPSQVTIPYFDSVYYNRFNEAKKNGEDFFATNLSFEEKNKFYQKLFEYIPGLPEEAKKFYFSCPALAASTVLLDNVCLYIENFSGTPYTDEENKTLMRFGKVFQQTYTRFLDLQKAEAQAREAKIEAALEKVRSRTLAMQKSAELGDVATVLFKEMNQLVENLWTCGFVLCKKDRSEDEWWLSAENGFIPAFYLPNTGDVTHANIYQGWLNGEPYHTEQLEGTALEEHYEWLMNIPVAKKIFDDLAVAGIEIPQWQKLHCAYFSKGYLCIITQVPCTEEQIFKRFAQVFDLTYTRFLDLQKAEAQAREAQVEAALEKVRSRSLAMHTANELGEVVKVIVEKLQDLGVVLDANGVVLCTYFDGSKDVLHWIVSPDFSMAGSYLLPYFDHPIFNQAWQSKENGDEYFSKAFSARRKEQLF
jgi:hypothetical protein